MSTFYAIKNGEIVNAVETNTLQRAQQVFPDCEVREERQVPRRLLEAYRYWNERP